MIQLILLIVIQKFKLVGIIILSKMARMIQHISMMKVMTQLLILPQLG